MAESDSLSNQSTDNSDHEEDHSKSQRGPTKKAKPSKGKILIKYNKRGVPIGDGAKKLSSFLGCVARSMVPIAYERWLDVGGEIKKACWIYVTTHYILNPNSRKHTLQSIGTKWKNFKHYLHKKFILPLKDDPEADLLTPPAMYPHLKIDDWKLFVAQRLSKKWEEKSKKAKITRAQNKYNHHLSRKGYSGLIEEIMQETGKAEEEIDRALTWKRARELKKGGYDPDVKKIVDKIEKLEKEDKDVAVSCGTKDVLTQALGNEEQRGRVRGMGKFVSQQQYFYLPKTVKSYLEDEKKKMQQRLDKVEDDVARLQRGSNFNASEGASCQIWEDKKRAEVEVEEEDEAQEELLDNSCYLAVDVPSNIVAKGNVENDSLSGSENIEVMIEICFQGEALLPFPLREEFIEKVKDAPGYILMWPRHLVIQCSYLKKITKNAKKDIISLPAKKDEERKHEDKNAKMDDQKGAKKNDEKETEMGKESKKEKKRQREPDEENEKELRTKGYQLITGEAIKELKDKKKAKVNEKETMQRRMTRDQKNTRVRMEKSVPLRMAAMMVDGQVSKVDSIKVWCEDNLFGYDSFTYLTWTDFNKVFSMDELSGAVVTSYTMYLYEQIKNGSKGDHGICFMTPTATMQHERKAKARNVDDSSRLVAERLSKRNENHIILLPYNPGRHWVLGVLDMEKNTCYYLDSLGPMSVDVQFKHIVDAAIGLYNVQSGSKKMIKLKWVNSKCPIQPGSTECGYYVLKFMKEIVQQGVEVLENDNVSINSILIGGDTNEFTDADFDEIREEWATYVSNFIFR
ncbi:hypothetical protein SSX86_023566 [Deinandra increscens subsp. villosa]|uniref:Ubiquitin-like protease family profile domain-containing protein n=1 Tax=Deinandra increscens subsp. villosa TaxID=3103831 RepID=A0AAP0GSG6_9ASTR